MSRSATRLALTTVVLVAVQITVVSPLRINGVVVMLIWLWPLALGLTCPALLAMGAGALTGLLFDSFSATPYGLNAVVCVFIAWIASRLAAEGVGDFDAAAWWVPVGLGLLDGLAAPLIYIALATVTGHLGYWRGSLISMLVLNALVFGVLIRPLGRLALRAAGPALAR